MSAAVARARALVGVRFRRQGRTAAEGLDCVGLVALVYRLEGVPRDYALRGGDPARLSATLAAFGFTPGGGAGALAAVRAGPGQIHLVVLTDKGFIHADAAARRVVERPDAPPWPLIGSWRREN